LEILKGLGKKSSYEMPEQSVGQGMTPKLISGWLDAVVEK